MKIFNFDGPIYRFGTNVFDLFILNIIWVFISILSVGLLMGNASVSLYYTINKYVLKREGRLLETYFRRFKQRFVPTFLYSIISLAVLAFSIYNIFLLIRNQTQISWLVIIFLIIPIYLLLTAPYVIGLLAHTELKLRDIIINSIVFMFKHFLISLVCLFIILSVIVLSYITSFIGMVFLVAPAFLLISLLINKKVFSKYDNKNN